MNLRSALSLIVIISILASCTKIESTDIGSGLIPPVDNITTFDTSLTLITKNLYDGDSVYPVRSDNLPLGRISNDPLFGKTTAILNLELKPEIFPYRFNGTYNSLQLDSMVLVLAYKGAWGDTNTTQTLNVYEISQSEPKKLRSDTLYSTKHNFATTGPVLGSAVVDVKKLLVDSLKPNKEPVNKNQIRIRITNTAFQNRIFKDTALLDSNYNFTNTHLFGSVSTPGIKGLSIVPDTSAGNSNSLLVVNLADTNTKLAIYYSYISNGSTTRESTVGYFRFALNSGFSSQVIRNPVGAEYLTAAADSLSYLQTRPDAPYTKIKIPGLEGLPNSIVHRAELMITQYPDAANPDLDKLMTPSALFLSAYSNDSSRRFMLPGGDVQFSLGGVSNLQDFGAYPFKRTINGQQVAAYAFDVTHYVQAIVTKKNRSYDLVLSAPFTDYVYASESFNSLIPIAGTGVLNPLALGRVRVGGGSLDPKGPRAPYRMRLRIIYTRI